MELLARFRVALGWVFAPLVLVLADPTSESILVGTIVGLVGEGIRIWAAGHLNKAREVTSSGPYRFFSHPLYVGSSVMGAGLAIASASPIAAGAHRAVSRRDAARGDSQRGGISSPHVRRSYDRYRSDRVTFGARRLEPSAAEPRRFSLAQAMANKEYRALAGLVGAMLLLVLKATYNGMFWRAAGP